MTEKTLNEWTWWVGSSDETFDTECASREEAISIAQEEYEDGAYICEAITRPVPLAPYFHADHWLPQADETASSGHMGESDDPLFEVSDEQLNDLEKMVRLTIEAWQEKHKLMFIPWIFSSQRNDEFIPAKGGRDE